MTYVGHDGDIRVVEANHFAPKTSPIFYFEVKIEEAGESGRIVVGFSDGTLKSPKMPGTAFTGSYGYRGDTGHKSDGSRALPISEEYADTFTTNDIIGAGIRFDEQEIFFTKNGHYLGKAFGAVGTHPLYPIIGLHSKKAKVRVNFGTSPSTPFVFDVDGLVKELRAEMDSKVSMTPLDNRVLHEIIRNYFLLHGYQESLASFDQAIECPGCKQTEMQTCHLWLDSLPERAKYRQQIMAGDVGGVLQELGGRVHDADKMNLKVALHCQYFIELIKQKDLMKAMEFAQKELSKLYQRPHYAPTVVNTVGLLAYEKPEVSPLAQLLSYEQREVTADSLNEALLEMPSADALHTSSLSTISKCIAQVVAVHDAIHEVKGVDGEHFFNLSTFLPQLGAGDVAMSIEPGNPLDGGRDPILEEGNPGGIDDDDNDDMEEGDDGA